ncbi:hypothetical protein [Kushneria sp. TE3]|uniref:hypothetical protein n=1 Tax=Kushneria sp. TE3 TaxID=3449832 RepID=UPI003F6849DD
MKELIEWVLGWPERLYADITGMSGSTLLAVVIVVALVFTLHRAQPSGREAQRREAERKVVQRPEGILSEHEAASRDACMKKEAETLRRNIGKH